MIIIKTKFHYVKIMFPLLKLSTFIYDELVTEMIKHLLMMKAKY